MKKSTERYPLFLIQLKALDIPPPQTEYLFLPPRKFRADYAWPNQKFSVEVDGGIWIYGRHNRATGFLKDLERRNLATLAGWCTIHVTPQMIVDSSAVLLVEEFFRKFVK